MRYREFQKCLEDLTGGFWKLFIPHQLGLPYISNNLFHINCMAIVSTSTNSTSYSGYASTNSISYSGYAVETSFIAIVFRSFYINMHITSLESDIQI